MVLALSVPALAADPEGSIEILEPKTDPNADTTTYEAYKIFDMTTDGNVDAAGNYTAVAYTINSSWAGVFAGTAPGAAYIVATDDSNSLNSITVDGQKKFINITEDNVADFAKAAFKYAQENSIAPTTSLTVDKGATSVKFEHLALGYYMIYPKGASVQSGEYTSIVSITNTAPNGQIAQKAEYPELTKTADDISTEVGQKVTYTLKSNVPDTTGYTKYAFTFKDKTSDGLTFDGVDTITVKIGGTELTKGTDYTVSTTEPDFALTINLLKDDKTAKYTYNAEIEVTYTATVNESAVTKIDVNHATLTYNNDPKDGTKTETTPPEEVKTYSSKIVIEKVDASNKTTKLEGAKFVLRLKTPGNATGDSHESDLAANKYYYYDEATKDVKWIEVTGTPTAAELAAMTTITVKTTDTNGAAEFIGLEDGVYELIEVEAPSGYNLLTTPTEVTIAGSNTDESKLTMKAEVENNSGTQLPSTGGIGTTIFYVLGGLLVAFAVVLLITKTRMSKEQ